jgi:peptide methionine sulfoxide reductase msrA/msrB
MYRNIIFIISIAALLLSACSNLNKSRSLSKESSKIKNTGMADFKSISFLNEGEKEVIFSKSTERPFTGVYDDFFEDGTYLCKHCKSPLFSSESKFNSGCGWPSFDDELPDAVKRITDKDGRRTEIVCAKCGGHLGHVFTGEGFTQKDTRHCVNSISLEFTKFKFEDIKIMETAIFAGGCFWGVEHLMKDIDGVISVVSGYIGGTTEYPTYKDVCTGKTGHAEAVRVIFDPRKTDYRTLAKLFFEIHDPEQVNRQGPDIGLQYRSEIFYTKPDQKVIAEELIKVLEEKGYKIATKVTEATVFWEAEDYHQDYYERKGTEPYCHAHIRRF